MSTLVDLNLCLSMFYQDLRKVSVCVTDRTEAQDSVLGSRDTQNPELSLKLLCYADAQDDGSADETSDCNAGNQQMQQTQQNMCSVKLVDCRNLIESRGEKNTAEEQQHHHEDDDDWNDDDENDGTEAQDSVWRSRDTQDSDSDTSLCYANARNDRSADETSDFNAGEQQMQQTQLKMCSVRLVDCKNLIESREEKQSHENDDDDDGDYNIDDDDVDDDQNDDDEVFFPSGTFLPFKTRFE